MDCISSLLRILHQEKFSCGQIKCESIVVNVLAPLAKQQILKELESVKYLTVMVDTSNHKNLKEMPPLVRYFTPEKRVQTGVIEFYNLEGKMADVLVRCLMNVLHKYKLSDIIIAFCGDNCIKFWRSCKERNKQCFCQVKDQQFKNEHSGYRMCCPYFA